MKRRLAAALLCGALLAAGVGAAAAAMRRDERTVVLDVRHSRFVPAQIEAAAGETVRFVVRNLDPIDHELIVGPMDVQLRHEEGREAWHPPVPGEVSVPLLRTAETTYRFTEAGVVWFGCHLPGHWDFGMRGTITVR